MFTRDMHHIQQEIISSLAHQSPQRFSQLQPQQIPNNTFSYHLKKLLQSGYITLVDGGYIATRKALKAFQYATLRDKRTGNPVFISAVYVTNDDGEVLLLERNNQPFVGYYSVPAGLIHQGEHLGDAAIRELFEKTSIEASKLQFAGVLDFQYLERASSDLFVHTVAFIYTYKIPGTGKKLVGLESYYGTLVWSNLQDSRVLPEVHTIAKLVKKNKPTLESIDYEEPSTLKV
jgi:ADP-ribose pyrophosphatase YjhB (NUDIX family)